MEETRGGRVIDYTKMLSNVDLMINTLEFDSMRSAGKCKVNAPALNAMYELRKNIEPKTKKNTRKEG